MEHESPPITTRPGLLPENQDCLFPDEFFTTLGYLANLSVAKSAVFVSL